MQLQFKKLHRPFIIIKTHVSISFMFLILGLGIEFTWLKSLCENISIFNV